MQTSSLYLIVMVVELLISVISIVASVLLALIPMNIGKKKGYKPGLCWLFGFLAFFPALFTLILLPAKEEAAAEPDPAAYTGGEF
ncbi:MAG: hypothetical protein J5879_06420 [Clostridia bacterium]|nr:hypothetical protein [Clostridia bacterium]